MPLRWGIRGVLVYNFPSCFSNGVSGGRGWYLCTSSLQAFQMGFQEGICVHLLIMPLRWDIRRYLCATSHFPSCLSDWLSVGYVCATFQHASQKSTRGYLCAVSHHASQVCYFGYPLTNQLPYY